MKARGLSSLALALKLRVPANRVSEIVGGKRGITPETALRRFFRTGSEFWAQLQTNYELTRAEQELGETIRREVEEAA